MRLFQYLLLALCLGIFPTYAQNLTIVHANVVDVATGQIQPDQTVVITGKRIVRVGPSAHITPPKGRLIDARGSTSCRGCGICTPTSISTARPAPAPA
ncbi:hypothetical protein [Hymenobacter sp. BRD67]|uniref:hypothetical protein n=1 Tax=Hymenobacter sp. BRD67 TaxID=2675877 RepID=UPI001C263069|nr:hypothetical protein [Hymenobacter sp. BRD67]